MTAPPTATLQAIAAAALNDPAPLTETIVAAIGAQLPELVEDVRTRELFHATVLDNVISALRAISGGEADLVDYAAPPVALEFARRLAQQGIALTSMLRAYRLGQAALVQHVMAAIGGQSLSGADVAQASMALSSFGFSFIDTVSEQVVVAYQVERDAWLRQRNASRLAKVRAVLSGTLTELAEIEKTLGFGMARQHVAAVIWADHDSGDTDRLTGLERHLAQLATALGATPRAALSVAPDDATLWAWIPVTSYDLDSVTTQLGRSSGEVRAAIGEPASGLDGFRVTHQQARQAQSLAMLADPEHATPLLASSELGPLALIASDVSAVRAWVQGVLGSLADDDENCARLRETVWTYLSSGSSPNTAAAALHLHKNTIQYRIRKAEEARGRPLDDGRIDVEVALLACRLLGAAVLRARR